MHDTTLDSSHVTDDDTKSNVELIKRDTLNHNSKPSFSNTQSKPLERAANPPIMALTKDNPNSRIVALG